MGGSIQPENIEIESPYSTLNVRENASFPECRAAYMSLATVPDRQTRAKICLAYDILCNKGKYLKKGNKYVSKEKDRFYCTVIGDINALKYNIDNDKSLLYKKDGLKRSLLYLAAINGYYNLTEYLLKKRNKCK